MFRKSFFVASASASAFVLVMGTVWASAAIGAPSGRTERISPGETIRLIPGQDCTPALDGLELTCVAAPTSPPPTSPPPTTPPPTTPPPTTPPDSSSWPGPTNTGVPAGVALTVVNGDMTINTAGAVIDARDVRGRVYVNAPNVTIQRSKVAGAIRSNSTGLEIVDVEIGIASGKAGDIAVGDGGYTCRRCDVHNFADGFRTGAGKDVTLEDSWVHDLYLALGEHNDAVQRYAPGVTSDDVIRGNRIDCVGCSTAAVFYADDWRGTLKLDNNLLSGGGFTVRIHESGQAWVTNNRIVRGSYAAGATYNIYGDIEQWSGNVYEPDGATVNKG